MPLIVRQVSLRRGSLNSRGLGCSFMAALDDIRYVGLMGVLSSYSISNKKFSNYFLGLRSYALINSRIIFEISTYPPIPLCRSCPSHPFFEILFYFYDGIKLFLNIITLCNYFGRQSIFLYVNR